MNSNFYMVRPEDLPLNKEETFLKADFFSQILQFEEDFLISAMDLECLSFAEESLQSLGLDTSSLAYITNDPNESVQNKDNDNSFNIIRVQGDILNIVLHSTLCAYIGMLKESVITGTNLSPEDWGKLRGAYYVIFQLFLGTSNKQYRIFSIKPAKNILASSKDSGIKRWKSGHYVFMTIIQAMIITFNCFKHEHEISKDVEDARYFMYVAGLLMRGAEAALKFAADFSMASYETEVRPTLSPPIAPPGMSGLYWRDHEYLIKKILLKMKPFFSNPPDYFIEPLQVFQEALANVYDAHKFVCTKFVGDKEPSLISKKPAGEVLYNYKKNRLHIFKNQEEKL